MGRAVRRGAGRQPVRDPDQRGWPGFQLRADPQLKAELDYCVPLGIPHSRFLGWSEADRGYALAWKAHQRTVCSGCGTRADEWAEDEDAYISDHSTCQGCARLAEEKANNLDRGPDDTPLPGQHAYLVPRDLYIAQAADQPPPAD